MNPLSPVRVAAAASSPSEPPAPTDRDRPTTAARLFDHHAPRLLSYLVSRAGPHVAEDLLSEVFVVVLRSGTSPDLTSGEAAERAWLFGVATNLLRRHHRDQVRALRASDRLRHAASALRQEGHEDDVIDGMDAETRIRRFAEDLLRLAPPDLDLLLLIAWGDLTPTEAADALGIPAGTVRSRLHRIRRGLRGARTEPPTTARNHDA